jgi:glycerol-3-phosphate dehydrogenase (NAD(P)+)
VDFFRSDTLAITLTPKYKNIELYGALKNIFALYMGYLEGKGNGLSTVGYHFCELYKDIMKLIVLLGGENIDDFSQYALGGDLIATCFGNSRNRYFGRLVGEGKSSQEAYDTLK